MPRDRSRQRRRSRRSGSTRRRCRAYVAAGGDESVQRVITAVYGLTRKLDKWYGRQLADLDLSHGEWAVLAVPGQGRATPP